MFKYMASFLDLYYYYVSSTFNKYDLERRKQMKTIKYPNGKCCICGKEFERPNKFRTQKEATHELKCKVLNIKYIISENNYDSNYLIDELENMSHKASFGARRDKVLYNVMLDCKKLKEKLEK